jgi:hypothetical protein
VLPGRCQASQWPGSAELDGPPGGDQGVAWPAGAVAPGGRPGAGRDVGAGGAAPTAGLRCDPTPDGGDRRGAAVRSVEGLSVWLGSPRWVRLGRGPTCAARSPSDAKADARNDHPDDREHRPPDVPVRDGLGRGPGSCGQQRDSEHTVEP